jgi:hypothetical protein
MNVQEYIYEIAPYYDKEKKQIRQKSKYIGKKVNGIPIMVRSQEQMPTKVLSHGLHEDHTGSPAGHRYAAT